MLLPADHGTRDIGVVGEESQVRHLTSVARPTVRTAVVIALTAFTVAACGGNDNQSNSTASSTASTTSSSASTTTAASSGSSSQAEAQIKQNWTAFFDAKTPADQKVKLLQNGQQFAPFIQQMAKSPLAQQVSAQVTNVSVNGQTATVTYSILLGNQPALTNQTGQAVLEDGTWKVGDGSFCALLALQGGAPSICPSAAPGSASAGATASTSG